MAEMSKYGRAVLALTAGFVLFCGGWFAAQTGAARPYRVSAELRPVPEETAAPEDGETEGDRPDSLLPGEVIDVNEADVYDLQRLPGIGEKRARDIIAYREEHGPFQTAEDLMEVPGIGPGILEGLREYATTEPPSKREVARRSRDGGSSDRFTPSVTAFSGDSSLKEGASNRRGAEIWQRFW